MHKQEVKEQLSLDYCYLMPSYLKREHLSTNNLISKLLQINDSEKTQGYVCPNVMIDFSQLKLNQIVEMINEQQEVEPSSSSKISVNQDGKPEAYSNRFCFETIQYRNFILENCLEQPRSQISDTSVHNDQSHQEWLQAGLDNKSLASLWEVNSVFRCKIVSASYVKTRNVDKLIVMIGLYHGHRQPLCLYQVTHQAKVDNPKWNQTINFDSMLVHNLPLEAVMCITLCGMVQSDKSNEDEELLPLAWVNIQLFDYRNRLVNGVFTLNLWPIEEDDEEDVLRSRCQCGINPNNRSPKLMIEFDSYGKPIVYPPYQHALDYVHRVNGYEGKLRKLLRQYLEGSNENGTVGNKSEIEFTQSFAELLIKNAKLKRKFGQNECSSFFEQCNVNRYIRCYDSLYWVYQQLVALVRRQHDPRFTEVEKDLIWRERFLIRSELPDAFPLLLHAVRWNCREEVCQLYAILLDWPMVCVDTAMVLLGMSHLDRRVKSFAVRCLDQKLEDNKLLASFMLQFVQLLKVSHCRASERFFEVFVLGRLLPRQ